MEILCVVPARGGSKGIPEKNIKEINGKPLIAYTIEEAKKSKYITRIIVSTDDMKISTISEKYGAEIPYIRPKHLAEDSSPTVEVIIDLVQKLKEKENYTPDYICVLQCTSPLRTAQDVDGAIKKLLNTEMDGCVSVCEVEINPYWTNVFNQEKLEYFIPEGKKILKRQDLPKIYRLNGAIYVVKTKAFLDEKSLEVENSTGYIMSEESSIDIDTIIDFKIAEIIMKEKEKDA